MGAELVGLGLLAPAAEAAGRACARADAVAPVILVGEAAARPAHDDRPELADVLDQGAADAVDIGDLGIGPDPDAVVDDAADVLGELAVERRPDRADRLVEEDGDRELRAARLRPRTAPQCPRAPAAAAPVAQASRARAARRLIKLCSMMLSRVGLTYRSASSLPVPKHPAQAVSSLSIDLDANIWPGVSLMSSVVVSRRAPGLELSAVALSASGMSFCTTSATAQTAASGTSPKAADIVLRGGTLIDGTGQAARRPTWRFAARDPGRRRVRGRAPHQGDRHFGTGRRPGFIDLHTHSDPAITEAAKRLNRNYVAQGVTTIVTGNCGWGVVDAGRYLAAVDAHGAGTNVIHLVPLGTLRSSIMGKADRPPSPDELTRMKQLVERAMAAGAWGVSSGLIYVPGRMPRRRN